MSDKCNDDSYLLNGDVHLCHFPKYVGELIIIDLHVSMFHKPSKWCMWWMHYLLGWTWRDF